MPFLLQVFAVPIKQTFSFANGSQCCSKYTPIPIWFSSGRLSVAITTAIDTNPDEINQSSPLFAPPLSPSPLLFLPLPAGRANSISAEKAWPSSPLAGLVSFRGALRRGQVCLAALPSIAFPRCLRCTSANHSTQQLVRAAGCLKYLAPPYAPPSVGLN